MIDKDKYEVLLRTAKREMERRRAKHACFGLTYDNIEDLADFPEEIKYFDSHNDFYAWIENRRQHYASFGIESVGFYAVHARD